jgi:hypothetical protein
MSKVDTLKSYLPTFITDSIVFSEILNAQGAEGDSLDSAMTDVLNQCYVDSATWGLKYWESFLGIPIDELKDTSYRRSVIKSKIRGTGTVTVDLLQSVAQSYDNGEIDVIEHNNLYSFEVQFIGTKGIPPNLTDLQAAIELIKPAHLAVTYTFNFSTHSYVAGFTHSTLSTHTHLYIREAL